jgi:hypothetical protein
VSIERGQAAILVVGGVFLGTGVTTLVLKKHYQKIADEEIASVKSAYKEKEKSLYRTETKVTEEDLGDVVITTIPEVVYTPNEQPVTRYDKIIPSPEMKAEFDRIMDRTGYSTPAEPAPTNVPMVPRDLSTPDPDGPYIISVDQFMANEEEFEQVTLTYYEGDGQMVDDAEDLIDDIATKIGYGPLTKFGKMSGNGDTVYVRNLEKEIDYEIIRDYRSYGKDMQGEEEPEPTVRVKQPKPPKTPKFRGE